MTLPHEFVILRGWCQGSKPQAYFGLLPFEPFFGMHFALYIFVFFFSVIHSYKELIGAEGQKLFFFVVCLPRATEVLRKAEHQENSP